MATGPFNNVTGWNHVGPPIHGEAEKRGFWYSHAYGEKRGFWYSHAYGALQTGCVLCAPSRRIPVHQLSAQKPTCVPQSDHLTPARIQRMCGSAKYDVVRSADAEGCNPADTPAVRIGCCMTALTCCARCNCVPFTYVSTMPPSCHRVIMTDSPRAVQRIFRTRHYP